MRKTLLSLAMIFIITGCDPATALRYEITNATESNVSVTIGEREPVSISPEDKKTIYAYTQAGAWSEGNPYGLSVKINNESVSDGFWLLENWELSRGDRHHVTYTLILTQELLEILLLE